VQDEAIDTANGRIATFEDVSIPVGVLDVTLYRDDLRMRAARAIGKTQIPPTGIDGRLVILVDHDLNGAGQAVALRCAERWSRAGREVVRLTPKQPGSDFNDLVRMLAS